MHISGGLASGGAKGVVTTVTPATALFEQPKALRPTTVYTAVLVGKKFVAWGKPPVME
jgi:hypothetical protein